MHAQVVESRVLRACHVVPSSPSWFGRCPCSVLVSHPARSSQSPVQCHWVVQAHGQESWLADAHRPAHALDCDLFDPARELTVLDLAVVVVVARVDLRDVLDAEFGNDVFRYCGCEHILILISCCYGDGMASFAMRTAVCV